MVERRLSGPLGVPAWVDVKRCGPVFRTSTGYVEPHAKPGETAAKALMVVMIEGEA